MLSEEMEAIILFTRGLFALSSFISPPYLSVHRLGKGQFVGMGVEGKMNKVLECHND